MAEIDPELFREIQTQVTSQFPDHTKVVTDTYKGNPRLYFHPDSDEATFLVVRIGLKPGCFTGELGTSRLTARGALSNKTGYSRVEPPILLEDVWCYSDGIPRSRQRRLSQLVEAQRAQFNGFEIQLPLSDRIVRSFVIMSPLRWAESYPMIVTRGHLASTDDPGFVHSLVADYQAEGEKDANDPEKMGILVRNEIDRMAREEVDLTKEDMEGVKRNRLLKWAFALKMVTAGFYFDKGMVGEYRAAIKEAVINLAGDSPEALETLPKTIEALKDEPKARFSINTDRTEVIFG